MPDHKPRRIKRWMLILPLSCTLLTLPFFVGILPGGEGTVTVPAATLTPASTTTRSSVPTATPNATTIIRDATIRASTLSAAYAVLDATATREAVLAATITANVE